MPEPHQRMIDETSAFLTWALRQNSPLPRIPTRRLDLGGFDSLLARPGARAAVQHWWGRAFERVQALADQ
ncbi:MAG: hypothetical protein CMJ49_11055 [Planctomycetaceae bacterium]|nr:hypothetical protein [Planctomycetaceae bacterium]